MNDITIDKTGWKKWRFDEFAQNISERVEPSQTDMDVYVGLEHIDPDTLHLSRHGHPSDVEGTKLRFYKGDIIFGRRRAYQRKTALATTDGICSAHAMVLRAKEDVVDPSFFPFLFHSKQFIDMAITISVGGLSPTINWKDISKQEFLLPPKSEQKRLAELLWAADEMIEKEKKEREDLKVFKNRQMSYLLNGHQHIQNNGKPDGWERLTISDLGIISTSSVDKKQRPNEKIVSLINYMDVYTSKSKKITSDIEFIQVTAPDKQIDSNQVIVGDVLFTPSSETKDDIGHSAVVYDNLPNTLYSYHLVRLRFNREIDLDFKRYLFNNPSTLAYFTKRAQGITRMTLSLDDFNETPVLLPPLNEQKQIAMRLSDIDKTIERVENSISFSQQIKQELINKII